MCVKILCKGQVIKIKNKESSIKRYSNIHILLMLNLSVFSFVKSEILMNDLYVLSVPTDCASMILSPKILICPWIYLCTNSLSWLVAMGGGKGEHFGALDLLSVAPTFPLPSTVHFQISWSQLSEGFTFTGSGIILYESLV